MVGFLGPGNNKKAAQYLTRTGSYATHGNKKGFVDENYGDIPQDQLNNALEKIACLGKKKENWQTMISCIRRDLKLKPRAPLKKYEKDARRGILNNSKRDSLKLLEALPICQGLTDLGAEIKKYKSIIKEVGVKPLKDIMFDILQSDYTELFEEIKEKAYRKRVTLITEKQDVFQTKSERFL